MNYKWPFSIAMLNYRRVFYSYTYLTCDVVFLVVTATVTSLFCIVTDQGSPGSCSTWKSCPMPPFAASNMGTATFTTILSGYDMIFFPNLTKHILFGGRIWLGTTHSFDIIYIYICMCICMYMYIYIYIHILTPLPCTSKHPTLLGWGKEQAAVYLHREAHRGGMILEDPSSEWTEWTGEVFLWDRDLCIIFSIFILMIFLVFLWLSSLSSIFMGWYWCSSFQKLVWGLFLGLATTKRQVFGCSCYHQVLEKEMRLRNDLEPN